MKFLVLTDLHENITAFEWINKLEEQVDEVLFLGDVSNVTSDERSIEILKKFKKKIYFIPGNLDNRSLPDAAENIVHNVHCKSFDIKGIKFAAFGGSNPTIFNTPFETEDDEIESKLDKISSNIDVLMTHAPSYGILDEIPSGLNVGSKGIRNIVRKYHPKVALSGHIHEAIGIKTVDGTLFINPGPAKDGHAIILDISGEKITAKPVGPND